MAKYFDAVASILPAIGACALCVMAGTTIADIVLRALFNAPIQGSYEIVQLSLVTAIYAGLGETFRRGAHLVVDLIDFAVPRLSERVLVPLANLLSLAVVAVFFIGAIQQGMAVARYGDTTMDLKIAVYWYWIPVIGGFGWALVCIAFGLYAESSKDNK